MAKVIREKPLRKKAKRGMGERSSEPVYQGLLRMNEPPTDLGSYVMTVFGEKGVGKTSFNAAFPDTAIIMSEPRRRNVRCLQISLQPTSRKQWGKKGILPPWAILRKECELILNGRGKKTLYGDVKRVVFDTADRCYDHCFDWVCWEAGYDHPNDAKDFGKTWDAIRRQYDELINELLYAEFGVAFTSHARIREVPNPFGEPQEQVVPTCKDKVWDHLKAVSDLVCYVGYYERQRVLHIRGNDIIWSACQMDGTFMTPAGNPIGMIPMGNSAQEAYTNFVSAYNNELEECWEADFSPEEDDEEDDAVTNEKMVVLKKKKSFMKG